MKFTKLEDQYTSYINSQIVILPVPYDGTSTWIKGADKGPEAIIDCSEALEFYDLDIDFEAYKEGIYTADFIYENSSPEKMISEVEKKTSEFLNDNRFVVTIGGEHSISLGPIRAYAEKFDNLSILQIDAHTDLREEYEGSKFNHACVMARAKELCPIVQVGIRAVGPEEKENLDFSRIFMASKIHDNETWMDQAIDLLTDNVYLTFDLDGLDPSILPSTGTPEPGGLQWYPTIKFLQKLVEKKNLVGFDVMELCPNPMEKSSDFLAAKLIYRILGLVFKKKELATKHK
ncbi:MAG: agmatinase [Bacteroidales bacterium]|nr:agmatinase [Bacteroidales bacterium]